MSRRGNEELLRVGMRRLSKFPPRGCGGRQELSSRYRLADTSDVETAIIVSGGAGSLTAFSRWNDLFKRAPCLRTKSKKKTIHLKIKDR